MTTALSNPFAVSLTETSGAPSWYTSLPTQQWAGIAGGSGYGSSYQNGDRLPDVAHSPAPTGAQEGIIAGFTGGAIDQSRGDFVYAASGGHASYGGNEVYALRFKDEVPYWYKLTEPTPNPTSSPNAEGANSDGLRAATHNYAATVYDETNDLIVIPYISGIYNEPAGGMRDRAWTFDLGAAHGYASANSFPVPYATVAAGGYWENRGPVFTSQPDRVYWELAPGQWDPVNQKTIHSTIWQITTPPDNQSVVHLDGSVAGTWTTANGGLVRYTATYTGTDSIWSSCAFVMDDLSTPVMVWLGKDGSASRVGVAALSNLGDIRIRSINNSGPNWKVFGAVYHAPSKAGLLWEDTGSTLYKLKCDNPNDPLNSDFTLSTVTVGGDTPTAGWGTYGAFQKMKDMGDGTEALVIAANYAGPSFICKLPSTEIF